MKKVLLASSALVGVAALTATPAAAQLEVSLGGFMQFHASAGDADAAVDGNDRGGGFAMNNEIYVNGEATADNGLEYGFQVQMDSAASQGGDIDESQVFISGAWGKVVLGNEDGAEDLAMVNGSYVGVGYGGIGNPTSTFLTNIDVGDAVTSVDISDSSDGAKATYWTPTFGGFQAGISYSPDTTVGNGSSGANPSGTVGDGFHDYVGLGGNYSGEFNGFGIDVGAVYGMADIDEDPQLGDPDNSLSAWGAGIQLTYMGFTAATGYEDSDLEDAGEHTAWDYGIGYSTGPWTIAAAGIMSEGNDGTGGSDDEWEAWSLTFGYQLAPGLALNLTGLTGTAEVDDEDSDVNAVTASVLMSF